MSVPATEPVEERILQDLEATLRAISTASVVADFYTDVRTVYAMDKALGQSVEAPCVLIQHMGTRHEFQDFGLFENHISLDLYLIVARGDSNWRRDIVRLSSDVRRAVMVDPHRGAPSGQSNAFDTLINQSEYANEVDGQSQAVARLSIEITFRDYISDPTLSA